MENLQAANYVLTLIRQLGQTDYEWLDPLISVSEYLLSLEYGSYNLFVPSGLLDDCRQIISSDSFAFR